MKYLIELNLDGHTNPQDEQIEAKKMIEDQLDSAGMSVKILWAEEPKQTY